MKSSEIVSALNSFMKRKGSATFGWYVGISNYPRTALFDTHKVNEKAGDWTFKDAGSADVAKSVVKTLLAEHNMHGSVGRSDTAKKVFVYKITAHTNQSR